MRRLRPGRLLALMLAALVVAAALIQLSGHGYFWTALRYTYLQGQTTAHIDDARNFVQAPIAAAQPESWARASQQRSLSPETLSFLTQHKSAAFLVAHKGEMVHESYFAPYGVDSRTNIFSMAKTVTTLLYGAAVQDGIVPALDAKAATWLERYATDPLGRDASLMHLAAMSSGHDWLENYYLPFNPTTELYFGGDAAGTVLRMGFAQAPGKQFYYSSASTQLLGVALSRALARHEPGLDLAAYLSRRLWQPLGMEGGASWSLDRERASGGVELAYCCIHASARQMARLGQLLLQGGRWQARQLIPTEFVERMTRPNGLVDHYGLGLWMDPTHEPAFYFMQGHLGQYVIVVPSEQLVIVRLGQYRVKTFAQHPKVPDEVYRYVHEGVQMARASPRAER
jgi:CubicO group peptidase (beta-lactamase class C family)